MGRSSSPCGLPPVDAGRPSGLHSPGLRHAQYILSRLKHDNQLPCLAEQCKCNALVNAKGGRPLHVTYYLPNPSKSGGVSKQVLCCHPAMLHDFWSNVSWVQTRLSSTTCWDSFLHASWQPTNSKLRPLHCKGKHIWDDTKSWVACKEQYATEMHIGWFHVLCAED
jgi:hypothetical protein